MPRFVGVLLLWRFFRAKTLNGLFCAAPVQPAAAATFSYAGSACSLPGFVFSVSALDLGLLLDVLMVGDEFVFHGVGDPSQSNQRHLSQLLILQPLQILQRVVDDVDEVRQGLMEEVGMLELELAAAFGVGMCEGWQAWRGGMERSGTVAGVKPTR